MARRADDHLSALCLPIHAAGWIDDLAPNTGGDDSAYTEAGPRPGRAVPDLATARLRPVLSGEQWADLELVTLAGGHATLDAFGAVQVGYRFAGEADRLVRGWTAPNWITGWSSPAWTTTETWRHAAVVVPTTQAIVVTYRDTAGGSRYAITWDPATASWGADTEIRSSGSDADVVVADADGRIVATAANRSYRSDDDGATWTLHSTGVWPSTHDPDDYDRGRAAWGADGTILAVVEIESSNTLVQLASADGLSTWSVVWEDGGFGYRPSVAALPQGGYLVAYLRDADNFIVVRRLSHAFDLLEDADQVVAVATAASEVALTVDPDGVVWLHHSPYPQDGTVEVLVSTDGGASFTALDEGAIKVLDTADAAITDYVGVPCEGAVVLLGHPDSTTNSAADGSVVAVQLGGWSNLPASNPSWTDARDWTARSGHGTGGGSSAVWLPGELPGNNGWTAAGAASQTFLSDGRLRILSSGDARSYSRTGIVSTGPATVEAGLVVPQDGSVASNDVAIDRWVSWTGHEYRIVVRFSETQIRVRDAGAGTTLDTLDYACDEPFQIAILVSTSSVDSGVWVRRPYETTWTAVWTGALTDNTATPTGSGGLEWGHISSSASSMSAWYFVADSQLGVVGNGLGATPAVGRPLTSIPVPLPAETGRAWLAATSGPGALGETFEVPVAHDYPIEAIVPTVTPSPAQHWRSTSTAEQVIAWDHGTRTFAGDSVALVALDANFRTAVLEYHDGSGWEAAGTLDLAQGFTGLDADLVGDVLTPATGTPVGARYLAEGEATDGHVEFITGSSARKIRWNTAGWWGGTGPQARILLQDVSGTEDTSGGVHLVWPSGVLVCHPTDLQLRRRWRVRIPASQATASARYHAGVLVPMAVRFLGQAPEWGWSRELHPNASTSTSRRGTTRTRSTGPVRRTWSMAWTSGVDQFELRQAAAGDWVSPDEHDRGTSWQDVPWLLDGLLELSGSGEVPAVALAAVPADGVTLTDPTLWVYGRLTSSIRQDHLVGTEGQSEVIRTGELVLEEVV